MVKTMTEVQVFDDDDFDVTESLFCCQTRPHVNAWKTRIGYERRENKTQNNN